METTEFDKLKMIYEKAAEYHRYFLSWRQFLLAGYFAVNGTLFYACFQLYTNKDCSIKEYSVWIALSISVISFLFLVLEERNRKLYQACTKIGAAIETQLDLKLEYDGQDYSGLFCKLDKSYQNKNKKGLVRTVLSLFTHTWVIRILYVLGIIIGICLMFHIKSLLN